MAFSINYKSSVKKDLRKISKSEQVKILDLIDIELSVKAAKYPLLKGEFKGLRKFRVGNYRVIYSLTGEDVLILKIRHRKDAYK